MSQGKAKQLRCRSCGTTFSYRSPKDQPYFPFCSERCRNRDLGRWFNEEYAIEGEPIFDLNAAVDDAEEFLPNESDL